MKMGNTIGRILAVATALMGASAHADGFVCQTVEGDLTIKAFNHRQPSAGTRNGAVLVVSDPTVSAGRKTIATFTDVKTTLTNSGAFYVGNVDLRVKESNRKGELISGTRLGELDEIILDLAFKYGELLSAGDAVDGELILVKRNGQTIRRDLACERYFVK